MYPIPALELVTLKPLAFDTLCSSFPDVSGMSLPKPLGFLWSEPALAMSLYALGSKPSLVRLVGKVPCSIIDSWDGLVNPSNGWLEIFDFVILVARSVNPYISSNTDSPSLEKGDWPSFLLVTGT